MPDFPSKNTYVAPTAQKLFRSTVLAIAAAITILTTMVLPAEYAIDTTGIGRLIGLTQMGEVKMRAYEQSLRDLSKFMDNAADRETIVAMQKRLEALERELAIVKSAMNRNENEE